MAGVKEAMGEAAEEGGGKFHKMLEGLKAEYGKKSLLGESFELLAGGGAIAGLSIFSEQVKNIVGGVADLAAQYKEGEISGGEMVDGILKSIPVFGGLYEAASKVVDVIDGQAEAERDLAKETAKENVELAEWQKRLEHIQQEKEVVAELTKEFRLLGVTLDQAFQLDGMKGVAREVAEIKFQATNAVSGITGKISDAFDTSIKQDQDAV
ncbi:MAG TPA: hypothetical protein VG798_02275, partial [Rhizomicrobium sp.]|nr:hypothetical protein [Rhizomicrobium sp.]